MRHHRLCIQKRQYKISECWPVAVWKRSCVCRPSSLCKGCRNARLLSLTIRSVLALASFLEETSSLLQMHFKSRSLPTVSTCPCSSKYCRELRSWTSKGPLLSVEMLDRVDRGVVNAANLPRRRIHRAPEASGPSTQASTSAGSVAAHRERSLKPHVAAKGGRTSNHTCGQMQTRTFVHGIPKIGVPIFGVALRGFYSIWGFKGVPPILTLVVQTPCA